MDYRLGQIEGALFQLLAKPAERLAAAGGGAVPDYFRTRIRRLLELDRNWTRDDRGSCASSPLAFHDRRPEGKGTDFGYSAQNAFCLAVGLELLQAGFQQKEVVEKIVSMRAELERVFGRARATRTTLGPTSHVDATKMPLPTTAAPRDREIQVSDPTIFLVMGQLDRGKGMARTKTSGDDNVDHELVFGIEKLKSRLSAIFGRRAISLHVMELSFLVAKTQEFLDQQPPKKRGRT